MDQQTDIWQQLSDDEMHFYSRQILLEGWDIDAQEKLKLANVLLIGAGGLGCLTASIVTGKQIGRAHV